MSLNRLTQLQQFYDDNPEDPFNIYALALEYQKTNIEKSRALFETLIDAHPEYVPTYYHAAKLFEQIGEKEKAIATFEAGISMARKQNQVKAARELQSALDELTFE